MKKTLLASAIMLSISTALAAPEGVYVYGALGYSHSDVDFGTGALAAQMTEAKGYESVYHHEDDDSLAAKLAVGYRFNQYFALEGVYTYLGKSKAKINATTVNQTSDRVRTSLKVHVLSVDALGIYPVTNNFEIFAKAGLGLARTKLEISRVAPAPDVTGASSESKTRVTQKLGLGAEWWVTDKVAVRAEYEHLFNVGKESRNSVDADYDVVSIGVKYAF